MLAQIIVLIAVLLVTNAYSPAEQIIKDHVNSYTKYTVGDLCTRNKCCTISETESCAISSMSQDESMLVLPGGETRCIFSTSTPFAFQVIPGDKDKLLFYLQGGGACWDEYSTKLGLCTTDVSPQSLVGIFDRKNADNQFKDYTIVHISYCSGDVHGGNTVQPYNDSAGVPVTQKGVANVQSALDWIQAQSKNGGLSSTFSELVVMGCSAGSIGAQIWGRSVLNELKWKNAAVIPDSYAGIFPDGTMGPLIYNFGFCTTKLASPALMDKCQAKTLTLQDIDKETLKEIPAVPFTFIQSKTDIVQQSFYVSVGISMNASSKSITPTEFYNDVNEVFGDYNTYPNFVTYLVNGDQHCFTNKDFYYESDTTDPHGDTSKEDVRMSLRGAVKSKTSSASLKLYEWTNQHPLAEGEITSTACDGTIQSSSEIKQQLKEDNLRLMSDNTYCSSGVVPKDFTEHY